SRRTQQPAKRWRSRSPAPERSLSRQTTLKEEAVARSAALRLVAQLLDATLVPAVGSGLQSTLLTRWKNIAGTFSEASRLCLPEARSTSPSVPKPLPSPISPRWTSNRLTFHALRSPSRPIVPHCCSTP